MRPLRPLWALALLVLTGRAGAQSLSDGGLVGTILDRQGRPIAEATIPLERGGTALLVAMADSDGRVRLSPLAAGRDELLAEQVGFQPVRVVAIAVLVGRESSVGVRLERRPPPVDAPTEVAWSGSASGGTCLVDGAGLGVLDWQRDGTDVTRGISNADLPLVGRLGLVASAGGLLPGATHLVVDWVEPVTAPQGRVVYVDTLKVVEIPALQPDVAMDDLFRGGRLSAGQRQALDEIGNGSRRFDLGDFLAWVERGRFRLSAATVARLSELTLEP